jgi:integrase
MWRARVIIDGKERKRFCRTKAEAQEAELELKARARQTTNDGREPVEKGEVPTLREMLPEFVAFQQSTANKKPNRPRSIQLIEQTFASYIDPLLGSRRVDTIGVRDVDRLAAQMEGGTVSRFGKKLGRNTVGNTLGILRRMLVVAKRWGFIEVVPEINAKKYAAARIEDDRWLTVAEVDLVIPMVAEDWRPIFVVALRTGLRLGELRGLQWADLHLDGAEPWIHVRRSWDDRVKVYGPPKGGGPREVPLTWDAAGILLERKRGKPKELVFPGEQGEHFSRSSYARALDLAGNAAEVDKHVHPHMTRHTFASHLVAKGVHAHIIRAWGGWQSDAMLNRYAHLAPREIRHLIDRIAPGGAALRVIDGGEVNTSARDDRGGYTGGYTPSASSKTARTRG